MYVLLLCAISQLGLINIFYILISDGNLNLVKTSLNTFESDIYILESYLLSYDHSGYINYCPQTHTHIYFVIVSINSLYLELKVRWVER